MKPQGEQSELQNLKMTEKKEEWEIGYSREHPVDQVPEPKIETHRKSGLLSGELLDGRFMIVRDLTDDGADEGGLGRVYIAKDTKLLGREVVVKVLQSAALKNADILRKFEHEKEALTRLDHPNIVRILDSGRFASGAPFIVMEFIEGISLRRKLRDGGPLGFNEAASIIESTTDALAAAHSKGILHRDIKPENIMLTPRDGGGERVRLIDFGIARVEDSILAPKTEVSRGIGTVLYVSPEQIRGIDEQTPASDIYSLAAVAYEMLTGKLPFNPRSLVEIFELQQAGVKTPPRSLRPEIPEAVEELILSGLQFEQAKRPANAREFGRAIANALRMGRESATAYAPVVLAETVASVEPMPSPAKTIASEVGVISLPETTLRPKSRSKFVGVALLVLLFASAAGGIAAIAYFKGSQPTPVTPSNSESRPAAVVEKSNEEKVELRYFLEVQKIRDGKPFEAPFKSSGQEVFENGYKFKLNVKSSAAGFIYAFAEERNSGGKIVYNILYPTPKTNDGRAEVNPNALIASGQNTFGGTRGTEIVWLIWSATADPVVEDARRDAFANGGTVTTESIAAKLLDFIGSQSSEPMDTSKDSAAQETVVAGRGTVVVRKIELEHR